MKSTDVSAHLTIVMDYGPITMPKYSDVNQIAHAVHQLIAKDGAIVEMAHNIVELKYKMVMVSYIY